MLTVYVYIYKGKPCLQSNDDHPVEYTLHRWITNVTEKKNINCLFVVSSAFFINEKKKSMSVSTYHYVS